MNEPDDFSSWDREALRDKLIALGLDSTDGDYSLSFSPEEYESLLGDYYSERALYQFEFFMYLAQDGGLELEPDTQLMRAFEAYSERLDYERQWGGFRVSTSDDE
jgi:hypothetical protein